MSLANWRKSSVKTQQTVWEPRSLSSVLQQPSLYHPVRGSSEQDSSLVPKTLTLGCMKRLNGGRPINACSSDFPGQRWFWNAANLLALLLLGRGDVVPI